MIVQNITVTTVTVTLLIKKSSFSLHVSEIFRTFAIVEEFFEVNGHDTMLYLADTGDRKQAFCNRLFVRWFNIYEHRDQYFIKTAEGKMDGQMNFLAIISRKDNPMLAMVIEEFNETISFLFDPPVSHIANE